MIVELDPRSVNYTNTGCKLLLAHNYRLTGTYGNFEIMPLLCPGGFDTCTVLLADRERFRKNNTDVRLPAGGQMFDAVVLTVIWTRGIGRIPGLLLPNHGQRHQDGGDFNAPRGP